MTLANYTAQANSILGQQMTPALASQAAPLLDKFFRQCFADYSPAAVAQAIDRMQLIQARIDRLAD